MIHPSLALSLPTNNLLESLGTSPDGLSQQQTAQRAARFGRNILTPREPPTLAARIYDQLSNPLILLLASAAVISVLIGNIEDAVSISLAVSIVLSVAIVQEYHSEKSLQALATLSPHFCKTKRNGTVSRIPAADLVPGDIVLFDTGDRIPADLRIISSSHLFIDESSLTGETEPIRKNNMPISVNANQEPILDAKQSDPNASMSLNLQTNQQIDSQDKSAYPVLPALSERANIAFMGTLVRNGNGIGVVFATGMQTELGTVFSLMQTVESRKTPLQVKMDRLGKQLSAASFLIISIIAIIGVIQGKSILSMFTIAVSLAVAAIPEGLPIVVTVTLALGVLKLASNHAIVKKLPSVESLGSIDILCVDKTGTITKNKMTVSKLFTASESLLINIDPSRISPSDPLSNPQTAASNIAPNNLDASYTIPPTTAASISSNAAMRQLLRVANICNNAQRDPAGPLVGQPSETAIIDLIDRLSFPDARSTETRLQEIPFNADRKWMLVSSTTSTKNHAIYYIKGALDPVLAACTRYYVSDSVAPRALDDALRQQITSRESALSQDGLRVLAMAYAVLTSPIPESQSPSLSSLAQDLVFVGMMAMYDPPRHGIRQTIRKLMNMGIRVVMITGDSMGTATSIARRVGIPMPKHPQPHADAQQPHDVVSITPLSSYPGTMSGTEIDATMPESLVDVVPNISVFYRTTPSHKLNIIQAFQSNNMVVAMIGDGVNDAPALRVSDIGISMGGPHSTDVAKEAADMILVNDSLATLVHAIRHGKTLFYNIQNFLCFQLTVSVSAVAVIAITTVYGVDHPMNPMMVLWINVICDGPVAQSLGVENGDDDPRIDKPKNRDHHHRHGDHSDDIITWDVVLRIGVAVLVCVGGTMTVFFIYMKSTLSGAVSDMVSNANSTAVQNVMNDTLSHAKASSMSSMSTHGRTMTFTAFVMFGLWTSLSYRSSSRTILSIPGVCFMCMIEQCIYGRYRQQAFRRRHGRCCGRSWLYLSRWWMSTPAQYKQYRSGCRFHGTSVGLFTNTPYMYAISFCILGHVLVLYTSYLQSVFQTHALSAHDLWLVIAWTSSAFWIMETMKLSTMIMTLSETDPKQNRHRKRNMHRKGKMYNGVHDQDVGRFDADDDGSMSSHSSLSMDSDSSEIDGMDDDTEIDDNDYMHASTLQTNSAPTLTRTLRFVVMSVVTAPVVVASTVRRGVMGTAWRIGRLIGVIGGPKAASGAAPASMNATNDVVMVPLNST